MLYREIMAVCSQIHTKHINTLCGQNVNFCYVKLGGTYSDHCTVHIVTTGPWLVDVMNTVMNRLISSEGSSIKSFKSGRVGDIIKA